LTDPKVGDFEVEVSLNEVESVIRRKLVAFFRTTGLDDVLLLHFSCHGLKDDFGHLFFATPDSELESLEATAVDSDFVRRQIDRSRSRRIVVLLDCCYSGAFTSSATRRSAAETIDLEGYFEGRGRAVITASSAMEYAFESGTLVPAESDRPSIFTHAVVTGLRTGVADRDGDGLVSVDDLYNFVFDEVRRETPAQTPGKWADLQGELYVARSPRGKVAKPPAAQEAAPAPFPRELLNAVVATVAVTGAGAAFAATWVAVGHDITFADSPYVGETIGVPVLVGVLLALLFARRVGQVPASGVLIGLGLGSLVGSILALLDWYRDQALGDGTPWIMWTVGALALTASGSIFVWGLHLVGPDLTKRAPGHRLWKEKLGSRLVLLGSLVVLLVALSLPKTADASPSAVPSPFYDLGSDSYYEKIGELLDPLLPLLVALASAVAVLLSPRLRETTVEVVRGGLLGVALVLMLYFLGTAISLPTERIGEGTVFGFVAALLMVVGAGLLQSPASPRARLGATA
jgi:hypothetical protein